MNRGRLFADLLPKTTVFGNKSFLEILKNLFHEKGS